MAASKPPTEISTAQWVSEMRAGSRLALARLISKVENRTKDVPEILKLIYPWTGRAQVWGITGPPGAGKSTTVDQIIKHLRKENLKVAVIAVDPSSPFSGGAVLGDRIRMQDHAGDEGVFIRSLGTRGKHGGLSLATREVILLLDAAQYDVILLETAGVGQTELEVLKVVQTVLVILVPESGDSIQVMKAGLMEIADVFAVNKSDRPQADQLVKELVTMVGLKDHDAHTWMNPVVKTEASRPKGIEDLIAAVRQHQNYLTRTEARSEKVRAFLAGEVLEILNERLAQSVHGAFATRSGQEVLEQLERRELDPYSAADVISRV